MGEIEVAGAVATIGSLVLALHDEESAEEVGGVLAADAVEVEVAGVEPCTRVAALSSRQFGRLIPIGYCAESGRSRECCQPR